MNNQNSEKENPSTIYFSPTGGDLPPIKEEDIEKGSDAGKIGATKENTDVLVPLQQSLLDYLISLPAGDIKDRTAKIIQKLSIPLQDNTGKILHKYVTLMNIIPIKEKIQQFTGTMEYNEIQEGMANKTNDRVNHPSHYTWLKDLCGIEVIDITRHMDFDLGNATKYILRQGHKSEEGMSDKEKAIEDLEKAIWYIKDKIEMLKKEE